MLQSYNPFILGLIHKISARKYHTIIIAQPFWKNVESLISGYWIAYWEHLLALKQKWEVEKNGHQVKGAHQQPSTVLES